MAQYKTPMTRGERTGLIILLSLLAIILLMMFVTRRCGSNAEDVAVPQAAVEKTDKLIVELNDSAKADGSRRSKREKRKKESSKSVSKDTVRNFLDEPVD